MLFRNFLAHLTKQFKKRKINHSWINITFPISCGQAPLLIQGRAEFCGYLCWVLRLSVKLGKKLSGTNKSVKFLARDHENVPGDHPKCALLQRGAETFQGIHFLRITQYFQLFVFPLDFTCRGLHSHYCQNLTLTENL